MVNIKQFAYSSLTGQCLRKGKYHIAVDVLNDDGVFVTVGEVRLGVDMRLVCGIDPAMILKEMSLQEAEDMAEKPTESQEDTTTSNKPVIEEENNDE